MKKQRSIICLAIIAQLLFVTVLSSCQRGTTSADLNPTQVVDAFYQACKNRSYDAAKSYLSPASLNYFTGQEQQNPNKSFRAFVDYCATNLSAPEFDAVRCQNERVNNNIALVDTAFVYKDNQPNYIPHHLVRDNNDNSWRLDMAATCDQFTPEPPKGDYREQLSRSGRWLRHPQYGDVWRPTDVGYDWQPYSQDGRFVRSEDGWEWDSDRDWGDRVFHYGRWVQSGPWGWCWVPSEDYSPAWVTWRANDDYVGWAPLSPGVDINNQTYNPPASHWIFVPTRTFVQTVTNNRSFNYREVRPAYDRYPDIIRSSTTYWGPVYDDGRVINRGCDVVYLERLGGVKIRPIVSRTRVDRRVILPPRNLPPGHGGIPPGQAKKYGYGYYDRHDEKEWRKYEKERDKYGRKQDKDKKTTKDTKIRII